MSEKSVTDAYEARIRQRSEEHSSQTQIQADSRWNPEPEVWLSSLLHDPKAGHSANSPARTSTIQRMQQTHGNRAVQRFVQRATTTQPAFTPIRVQRFLDELMGGVPDFKGMGIGQPFMPDGGLTAPLPDFGLPDLGQFGIGSPFEMDPQYFMD